MSFVINPLFVHFGHPIAGSMIITIKEVNEIASLARPT